MKTLQGLGEAVSVRRAGPLALSQGVAAVQSGITQESLSRLERGHAPEFGSCKLLAVLAVLGMELYFIKKVPAGSLDELRRERGGL